jgi:predicted  nucleic acid-binding Zn-ribbon protein
MTEDNTHSLVQLGIQLNEVKGKIAATQRQQEQASEPEEIARLQQERRSYENKETALLNEMKRLAAERHST